MKRWGFKVPSIIPLQRGLLWSLRLSGVQTARFLIYVKGGVALFANSIISACYRKSRLSGGVCVHLSDSCGCVLSYLCQRCVNSQQGCLKRASLSYNSPFICFNSHLFHPFSLMLRSMLALFLSLSVSLPLPLSALLGVGCYYWHPQFDPIQSYSLLCHQHVYTLLTHSIVG